ncbi:MAG TPA: efflux RND transporter periplasmic adaptor subunit [Gemmataceae bacterium]|nr:efflux RND transporter periplasmic adaptor subunit [Gemmataceae bacterium]
MVRGRRQAWLLAALWAGVVGCGFADNKRRPAETERLPHLETVEPERYRLPVRIELSAMIEAMEKADLCARVPGVVESLQPDPEKPEVDIGRRITAGEPLVKLAVPDLEADLKHKEALLDQAEKQKQQAIEAQNVAAKDLEEAKTQEQRYQAEFRRSKEKHDRTSNLVQRGALQPETAEETKYQLEAATAAWQASKAMIASKQARLAATDADLKLAESRIRVSRAEVHRLEVLVGYATVRAPFDGLVTKRWVDRGAMVKDPAIPLLTVMRTDLVRVLVDIPERDVPLVNATDQNPNPDGKGDPVELRLPTLGARIFTGHITRIASALDPTTRTMRAEVHLDNRVGVLRPGMYGTALITLDQRDSALTVPSTALVRRGDKVEVFYVADPSGDPPRGVARRIEVELGLDDGKRVEIRSGLTGKELIIAKGNGVVREGDAVVAVAPQEP